MAKDILSYGAAKNLQTTSISDIIELLNAFSSRSEERKNYYDTKVGKEILPLKTLLVILTFKVLLELNSLANKFVFQL